MPQIKVAIVTSDKMQKTAVVKVTYKVRHPLYKKLITRSKKFKAANELGAKTGQRVKIIETRPLAKDVKFKILEIL